MTSAEEPRQGAQAIRRALAVLRIIATGREGGVPLMDIVQATGLTRPTVHRIVHVLIEEGVVEYHAKSKRYAIGGQVPELALARQSRPALLIATEPILLQTSRELGDTLFLTVRTGLDTLCVARHMGGFPIQVLSIDVGARRPLGVSSAGVALLSKLPAEAATEIVHTNKNRFKAYHSDVATVLRQVGDARRRGYCIRHIGLVPDTKSLSACILGADRQPIAAITLSAIRRRLGAAREAEVAETLMRAARAIERILPAAEAKQWPHYFSSARRVKPQP